MDDRRRYQIKCVDWRTGWPSWFKVKSTASSKSARSAEKQVFKKLIAEDILPPDN